MAVSAHHFTEVTNGYEQKTTGLWVHRGKFSAGPVGTAPHLPGDINANRGGGAGVYYFGGDSTKYLYYDGTNFTLAGGNLNFVGAPGTGQVLLGAYNNAIGWTTPSANVWHETPAQFNFTNTTPKLRAEFMCTTVHPTVGAVLYLGLGYDGNLSHPSVQVANSPGANYLVPMSGTVYFSLTPGAHRISLWMHATTAGNGFYSGAYAYLAITEQKI